MNSNLRNEALLKLMKNDNLSEDEQFKLLEILISNSPNEFTYYENTNDDTLDKFISENDDGHNN